MKLSRRNLLIVGGVAALPPAMVAGRAAASTPEDSIVRYLRSSTGNTSIPDTNMYQFAEKFVAANRPTYGRRFDAAMLVLDNNWARSLLSDERRVLLEWFERRLVTDFLFSTDFFTDAGRNPQRMRYVDYADPYTLGCRNPLANFDLEA